MARATCVCTVSWAGADWAGTEAKAEEAAANEAARANDRAIFETFMVFSWNGSVVGGASGFRVVRSLPAG